MMIKHLFILFASLYSPYYFAQEIAILQYCNKPLHARGKTIKYLLILFVSIQLPSFFAQDIAILQYCNKPLHARGIAVKGNFIFLGNNNGEVIRYHLKNGQSKSLNPKDTFPEIRDLALHKNSIYAMQSADYSIILKFSRFGKIMKRIHLVAAELNPQLFLDGMAIENKEAFVMGDPVGNEFSLFHSSDLKHWEKITPALPSFDGEAGFAASGSTVQISNGVYYFVSGGDKSRFFRSKDKGQTWIHSELPFNNSNASGAFSLAMKDTNNGIIVGGDYLAPNSRENVCFITKDGGITWNPSTIGPYGYRSCVHFTDSVYYSCGTNGIDYSKDNGTTWTQLSNENGFSICSDNKFVYASSTNGRIIRISKISLKK
jgi:photosystem II stability/assembly factor-like uncharacterized protein